MLENKQSHANIEVVIRLKKVNDGFPLTGPKFEGSVGKSFFLNFFCWYRTHITHANRSNIDNTCNML